MKRIGVERNRGSLTSLIRQRLPRGGELPLDQWNARHRTIMIVLWLHALGLPFFSFVRGHGFLHGLLETSPVVVLALAASSSRTARPRTRAVIAAVALLLCSAMIVHLSDGMIEAHFHFFVIVGLITLYQDWMPFLAAIAFTATHHAVLGMLQPEDVFNHPAAWAAPLKWAAIHAAFVLAASAAQLTTWRMSEEQHERSAADLKASERRFRSLIEKSSDGISVISGDGVIAYEGPSVTGVMGYERDGERVGRPMLEFVHPDDIERAAATLGQLLEEPGTTQLLELRVKHNDGSWRWIQSSRTNLLHEPDIAGIVANFRDITERKSLESQLEHQAFHDPLTGLANRALFLDRVQHALATHRRSKSGYLGVLFLDLDDFKTINDGLGHAAGDTVLVEAAARIGKALRASDTCARLGGDEFAVLLEGLTSPSEAYEVGGRVLEQLCEPLTIDGNVLSLNGSLGIVVATGEDDADTLVRNADVAMYKAKGGGKGRYEIFELGMHEAVIERLELKADMRRAVDAGEFVAHYQPIVDLHTNEVVGAEALMRWEHPVRGLLAPYAFIELAEETGLIVRMGRDILRQACVDAIAWQANSLRTRSVSVNLSARQLLDACLVEDVADALAESGLASELLTLEITESMLIADPEAATDILHRLKALGVVLALDDFGTGYSSLSYLSRFPVDSLKIDKSFVDSLSAGTDSGLVGAIISLGKTLAISVTAEGIEEPEQATDLRGLGCKFGQGYHYAKPMPVAALNDLLFERDACEPVGLAAR